MRLTIIGDYMTRERVQIAIARLRHGDKIYPVGKRPTLEASITIEDDGTQMLWYNDSENSTHVVSL